MKFKHKELVLGIIIGAIIFGTIGTLADDLYNIMPNPFKILVNGSEKYIEGYNINGYSYFKLRDIGEQMGFDVDFKEDVILINSKNDTSNEVKSSYQDSYDIYTENGIKYCRWTYYKEKRLLTKTYIDVIINDDNSYNIVLRKDTLDGKRSRDDKILLENIEYITRDNRILISEQYFNDYILPLDK